ncbi:hypothetical protein ABPG77_001431 [Micractinium sp. CCAP 211/92]
MGCLCPTYGTPPAYPPDAQRRIPTRPRPYPCRLRRNVQAANSDLIGCLVAAVALTALLLEKTGAGELQPATALLAAPQIVHLLVLAALARWRRRFYARWRERLYLGSTLHVAVNSRLLATHGQRAQGFEGLHRGSAVRLLALVFLPWSHSFWACLFLLYGSLPVRTTACALPLLMLVPLVFGKSVCSAFVADPSMHPPLRHLYEALNTIHGTPLMPIPFILRTEDTREQCLVVDLWLMCLGAALPIVLKLKLERAWWRRRQQQRRRPLEQQQQGRQAAELTQPDWGTPCIYLSSCMVWLCAGALVGASYDWFGRSAPATRLAAAL